MRFTILTAWVLIAAPALAALPFSEDFESGTLIPSETPAGKWDSRSVDSACATAGCVFSAPVGAAGSHRGTFGLAFDDKLSTSGSGAQGQVTSAISGAPATLYGRFWFRVARNNGLGRASIARVQVTGSSADPVIDLSINPSTGTFEVAGINNVGGYPLTAAPFVPTLNRWYLFEFQAQGIGTTNGTLRGYIDGSLKAELFLNLSASTAGFLTLGEPFSNDRTFTGLFNFDDYRVATLPLASRWVLTGPIAPTSIGSCTPITATLINSIDGAPAAAPYTLVGGLTKTGSAGSFYSDATCTAPATTLAVAAGTQGSTTYFRPDEAGSATLSLSHIDFLTGTTNLPISTGPGGTFPPSTDGGGDGGIGTGTGADALNCPTDNPLCGDNLKVGSSCAAGAGATNLSPLWLIAALSLCVIRRSPLTSVLKR